MKIEELILKNLKHIVVIAFLVLVAFPTIGQEAESYYEAPVEHREFDKERWEKTVEGIDFGEVEKEKEKKEKESQPFTAPDSFFGDGKYVRILFYSIFIVFFAILLVRLMTGRYTIVQTKLKSKKTYTIEDVEDHLHESDLERFLRESLEQGNFRQAIRMYYLIIIKELSQKSWIRWKKDKTNFDYLREMRKKSQFPVFRTVTRIFDKVWYGETDVDEPDYNRLKTYFENFLKAIKG